MDFGMGIKNAKQLLDYSSLKNNIIANNLANVNNPNFKRNYLNDVVFEDVLKQEELKISNDKHIATSSKSAIDMNIHVENTKGKNDGNNVNLDKEIIDMTKNKYVFQAATEVLSSEYKTLMDVMF